MPNALDVDKEGDVGDWRIAVVARLAKAVPAAGPGAPAHPEGTPVYQSSYVKAAPGEIFAFTTPSAVAMALNVAREASAQAAKLGAIIRYDKVTTPDGVGKSASQESLPLLYGFFEQCMVSAIFSFQAVEAFCNQVISRELRLPMDVKLRGKRQTLTPSQLERLLSTEEKLCQVLPNIRDRPTPKGKSVWEPFKRLQTARDSTVHLKSRDQYTMDEDSLFFQFLSHRASEFPVAASQVIKYYFARDAEPRWLLKFMADSDSL